MQCDRASPPRWTGYHLAEALAHRQPWRGNRRKKNRCNRGARSWLLLPATRVQQLLIRSDDSANLALGRLGAANAPRNPHGLRDDVDVFEPRPSIEDHDFVTVFQESVGQQFVVRCSRCSSLGTEKDALLTRPME